MIKTSLRPSFQNRESFIVRIMMDFGLDGQIWYNSKLVMCFFQVQYIMVLSFFTGKGLEKYMLAVHMQC